MKASLLNGYIWGKQVDKMSHDMGEEEFRNKLIRDLRKRGINAVNLHRGTFDLIVEGNRPYVVELKRIREKPIGVYDEGNKGFRFTEEQTEEISNMEFPPVVIAFEGEEYYLLTPDWIQEEVGGRLEHGTAILSFKYCQFPNSLTYEQLLEKLVRLTAT